MVLYHTTTPAAAQAILAEGFKDATGSYGLVSGTEHSGVWLSDRQLDANEGAQGDVRLEVTLELTESELADYEWVSEVYWQSYREWLVPSSLVNPRMKVRVLPDVE